MQTTFAFGPRRAKSAILGIALLSGVAMLGMQACKPSTGPANPGGDSTATDSAGYFAFRNAVTEAPAGAKHFELSKNYPTAVPPGGEEMPWLKLPVDFTSTTPDYNKGPWKAYMQSILDYVKEGQDPNLTDEAGYNIAVNGNTRWFNMPWMAYNGTSGREWHHGCTNERSTTHSDLDGDGDTDASQGFSAIPVKGTQKSPTQYETWAVGYYNDFGGYNIGQVFPTTGDQAGVPQLNEKGLPKGLPFVQGTCVMKLLFTAADSTVAPYLANSPKWMVDRHVMVNNKPTCERTLQPVRLIQMDVAVADHRSPTGWVYGTFVYNGTLKGATIWDRMQSLGIQYGNDPTITPATADNGNVFQSVLNKDVNIYEHLGCHKRLCGPADNVLASCMSCHGGAFTSPMNSLDTMGVTGNIPPIFGFKGECDSVGYVQNVAFFSNRKFPEPYFTGLYTNAIPLDYSLQLWVGFSQYKVYKLTGNNACTLH